MRKDRLSNYFVFVCSIVVFFMPQVPLHAAYISLDSSTVTVAGRAGGNTYPPGGSCTGTTGDGSTWFASSSGSMSSSGATLNAECHLVSGSGDAWMGAASSMVELKSDFWPLSRKLIFKFTGSTGDHSFESYCDYSLTDLTTNEPVDKRHWAWEYNWRWMGEDSLPYMDDYTFELDHKYQLILSANSRIGDLRQGYANLQLSIIPEPASLLLLGLGGFGLLSARKSKRAVKLDFLRNP